MVFNGTGKFNSAFGAQTLPFNTSGFENAANGMSALFSNGSGNRNTASGFASLFSNTSGNSNTATGNRALYSNNTGNSNTANGFAALYFNNGHGNTAVGFQALYNNNQNNNTAVGWNALFSNTGGVFNTGVGSGALFSNNVGSSNNAFGNGALNANISGSGNNAIGNGALNSNTIGQFNTAVGNSAGAGFDGNNNTFIGSGADASANGLINSSAIGSGAIVTASNNMILGDNSVNVGIGLSGVAGGPQNKLEINTSNAFNTPNTCSGTGFSGLRFRDLTSGSTPCSSNNLALSVDGNGNVILVPGGGTAFGGTCGSTPTALANNFEIPMATFNYVFTGQNTTGTNVGIGTTCSPGAKLDVLQTNTTVGHIAIRGTANNTIAQVGVEGDVNSGARQIGVKGTALNPSITGAANKGGEFLASGNGANYGVDCRAVFSSTSNIGGNFIGIGGTQVMGVRGVASTTAGTSSFPANIYGGLFTANRTIKFQNTYGVFAQVVNTGFSTTSWAGYFAGDVFTTGQYLPSDEDLKKNVSEIGNGLSTVRRLEPETFYFDTTNFSFMSLSSKKQYGFTAQQMDTVIPDLVTTVIHPAQFDSAGNQTSPQVQFKGLNYTGVIPFAISAIKQLDSTLTKATSVPGAPVLISPANGTVGSFNTRPGKDFTWHSVSQGIILYHAQIAKDNSFSTIVFDQSGITDTTFSAGFCDSVSTTYYWRVNAKNNTGTGAWSSVFSFTDTAKCLPIGPLPFDTIRPRTAVSFNSSSDSRLKTNVAPVTDALDKVSQLNGIYYDWIPTSGYEFDSTQQIGFIAQDVQSVVPEVVRTDANGFLTLDYGRLVPVLVQAIKEQQAQITALQSGGSRTNGNGKGSTSEIDVTLASKKIVLDQNNPNPFKEQTTINYFIPKDANSVMIIFTDMDGDIIKEVRIAEKGKGQLNVYASDLSSGIYTYSIVADGVTLDSKKMVKTK